MADSAFDYKRNPQLFIAFLKNLPAKFEKHALKDNIIPNTHEIISQVKTGIRKNIDEYIDTDHFLQMMDKVNKLVEMEDEAKLKGCVEITARIPIDNTDVSGLEEKELLAKRDRLIQLIEMSQTKSKNAEDKLIGLIEKHKQHE